MSMEETEELSNPDENVVEETGEELKADVKALISPERAQQFQLLIHLISNRQQPLVLSGPDGIGKTTAIDLLHQRKRDSWQICAIEAEASLNLEQILQVLVRSVEKKNPDFNGRNWAEILAHFEHSRQKLVLVLDEAGMLAPGMMGELCKFSETYPVLRIVFALTPDQLHVVNSSDKAILDCFFIEFPPLTEKQCGDFLQNLSCKPGSAVRVKSINPDMVENLYRETHGIPGRIVKAFSGNARFSSVENQSSGSSLLLGSVLIAAVVGFVWWSGGTDTNNASISDNGSMKTVAAPAFKGSDQEKTEINTAKVSDPKTSPNQKIVGGGQFSGNTNNRIGELAGKPDAIDVSQTSRPVAPVENQLQNTHFAKEAGETAVLAHANLKHTSSISESGPSEIQSTPNVPEVQVSIAESFSETTGDTAVVNDPTINSEQPAPAQSNETQALESHMTLNTAQQVSAAEKTEASVNADSTINWVLQQPSNNFTLQLMVLSKLDSLKEVMQRYPMMQEDFRYFKMPKTGKTQHYLLYGSFDNRSEAVKTMQSLPKEFQQAWLRRFSGIQNKIRAGSAN